MGSFNKADEDVGTGLVGAPACGDVMRLQIRVRLPNTHPAFHKQIPTVVVSFCLACGEWPMQRGKAPKYFKSGFAFS